MPPTAAIDRELYLPESWTSDRDRCRGAGIGDEREFLTKPRVGMGMLERAAGVSFSWMTADEAYGQVKYLRVWLEQYDAVLCYPAGKANASGNARSHVGDATCVV